MCINNMLKLIMPWNQAKLFLSKRLVPVILPLTMTSHKTKHILFFALLTRLFSFFFNLTCIVLVLLFFGCQSVERKIPLKKFT